MAMTATATKYTLTFNRSDSADAVVNKVAELEFEYENVGGVAEQTFDQLTNQEKLNLFNRWLIRQARGVAEDRAKQESIDTAKSNFDPTVYNWSE